MLKHNENKKSKDLKTKIESIINEKNYIKLANLLFYMSDEKDIEWLKQNIVIIREKIKGSIWTKGMRLLQSHRI